jgi:hypothetical protein
VGVLVAIGSASFGADVAGAASAPPPPGITVVTPTTAARGSTVVVSGAGLPSGSVVELIVDPRPFSEVLVPGATTTTDDIGAFAMKWHLSDTAALGRHVVQACAIGKSALVTGCLKPADLTITAAPSPPPVAVTVFRPVLVVTPGEGRPYASLALSGSGWNPHGGVVSVFLTQAAEVQGGHPLATAHVGPKGAFHAAWTVAPDAMPGGYSMYACQGCGKRGSLATTASFGVLAAPAVTSTASGPAHLGSTRTVSFQPPRGITLGVGVAVVLVAAVFLGRRGRRGRRGRLADADVRLVGFPASDIDVSESDAAGADAFPALSIRLVPHPDVRAVENILEVRR